MDNDLDELTNLLDSDTFNEEKDDKSQSTTKKSTNISQLSTVNVQAFDNQQNKSEIHTGDTDSSDDEDNKYTSEQKYTETGRSIKNSLKKSTNSANFYSQNHSWKSKNITNTPHQSVSPKTLSKSEVLSKDVYSDPFFGIRIITPLISSNTVKEKMVGKIPVTFSKLEKHLQTQDNGTDWVIAGVIVSKYIKTSQKGNQFACWTLSDLRDGLKTVSVFLFGKAYKDLWKTSTHIVVAILNPTTLDNRKGSGDIAALSVMNSEQVMIWGQSKDLGICRARKKNGEPCTSFVNKNQCEYCVYHVKQEYKKFTGRSELQASWGGSLNQLRNKVLGKNEVFYAGKSFTAVVAKPNTKQVKKDKTRLSQLFNMCESRLGFEPNGASNKPVQRIQSNRVKLLKDAQRLQSLTGSPATLTSLALEGPDDHNSLKNNLAEAKMTKRISKVPSGKFEDTKTTSPSLKPKSPAVKTSLKLQIEKAATQSPKTLKPCQKVVAKKGKDKTLNEKASPMNNSKKQPTKNRFENLTKLKSKTSASERSCDKKIASSSKRTSNTKLVDMLDVSFEFDESEDNMLSCALDEVESNLKEKCSETDNVIEQDKNSSVLERNTKNINKSNLSNSSSNNKFVPEPLQERKSPTKHETTLNTSFKRGLQEVPVPAVRQVFESAKCQNTNGQDLALNKSPKIAQFGSLSLCVPIRKSRAKENALKYVKLNGPINKEDPVKPKYKETSSLGKKRKKSESEENAKDDNSTLSKRFLDLMNTTSKHLDLISNAENEALDEYYDKMEKKEKMEEKMLNTFKIDCKAFKCLKCKYKWFSPSELCKAEKHPIKMISAVKRFFQCQHCKNRTVSLEIIPLHNCSNCGSANWLRAAMMRERKATTTHLSIRGGEQKFTNSVMTDTNLDLLVPDDT